MYNKNGLLLLNRTISSSSTNVTVNLATGDSLTGIDGTTIYSVRLINTSGTLTYAQAANAVNKLSITGLSTSNYYVYANLAGNFLGVGLVPGYRSLPFDENTFSQADTRYSSMASVSAANGIPTLAVINSLSSDIVINNIDVTVLIYDTNTNLEKHVLIAGFSFPDVTIAPGESYTFTFMHKNS